MPTCFPRLLKASPGRKRRFYEGWVPYSLGSARTGATGAVEREAYEGHWATVYRQRFDLGISSADSICIPLYLRLRGEDSRAKWRAARLRREGVKKGGWVVWISEDTGYLYATTVAQWTHSNRQQWHDECRERCDQRCALASRVQTATAKSSCDINKSSGGSNAKGNNGEQTTDSRRSSGAKGLPSTERRILNLFVLLHGMSPPAVLQTDVVENFGNLLATILERFPTNQKQKQSFLSSSALSAETACVGSGAGNVDPTDAGGPLEGSHLPPGTTSAYATAGASSKGVLSCQDSTTAYPATLLFLIYSYRDATWQSVAACMARIVPLLADELQVLLQHWDEVRLFAVGHSLGGLLWRFVMLRRLQQLLFPPSNKQATGPAKKASAVPDCYNTLLKALQHPKLRLETFCTLASPHVGAYKSSAVYRSMPRAVAGLRFLPNSNYAQDLLLQSDKGVLAALAEEERAGRSHMTYPFSMSQDDACSAKMFQQSSGILNFQPSTGKNTSKIFQEQGNTTNEPQQHGRTRVLASCGQTSQSATLSSPPQAFEAARETHVVPGEVPILAVNRFKRVVLYGIYETDWIVSANSALATAADLRKTPEGRVVTQRPMYPVRLKSATANSACTIIFRSPRHHRSCKYGIRNSTSKCNTELLLAQQHIDVFNHVSFIERYLVYIDQNPLFLAPHATIKGSPCIVTVAEQRKMRKEAAPILEHVAAHILAAPAAASAAGARQRQQARKDKRGMNSRTHLTGGRNIACCPTKPVVAEALKPTKASAFAGFLIKLFYACSSDEGQRRADFSASGRGAKWQNKQGLKQTLTYHLNNAKNKQFCRAFEIGCGLFQLRVIACPVTMDHETYIPRRRMICVVRDTRSCPCICHRYCECRCCDCCSIERCRKLRNKSLAVPSPPDLDASAWIASMAHAMAARRARFAAAAAAQAEKTAFVAHEVAAQARAAERCRYVQMLQSAPSKRSCTALVKQRQKLSMRRLGLRLPPEPRVIERHITVNSYCGAYGFRGDTWSVELTSGEVGEENRALAASIVLAKERGAATAAT
ncbi:uncharacterized protein LOC113147302 [Cyclospora cayetanensis]|uniref:Uncharacterized protein LOC113147302 n=1 Tax=Cyclospora cayetanensis TaxID=88456 RepID=A0A6P6RZB9_9EIME|nr:uncharacterized protein LOC113147302 [Cyclospora cayetanensis]